jgi:hypothetical protein
MDAANAPVDAAAAPSWAAALRNGAARALRAACRRLPASARCLPKPRDDAGACPHTAELHRPLRTLPDGAGRAPYAVWGANETLVRRCLRKARTARVTQ